MKVNLGPNVLLLTGIAVAVVYIVYYWQDVTKGNLTGSFSVQHSPISATVTPASSVRCNRISLPSRFYNATTAPYNPAAMRNPVTGNWVLVHNYDEVSTRTCEVLADCVVDWNLVPCYAQCSSRTRSAALK